MGDSVQPVPQTQQVVGGPLSPKPLLNAGVCVGSICALHASRELNLTLARQGVEAEGCSTTSNSSCYGHVLRRVPESIWFLTCSGHWYGSLRRLPGLLGCGTWGEGPLRKIGPTMYVGRFLPKAFLGSGVYASHQSRHPKGQQPNAKTTRSYGCSLWPNRHLDLLEARGIAIQHMQG